MIIGTGIDLIELKRVKRLLQRQDRLVFRILTDAERDRMPESLSRKAEYVAGRFAAKEALAKAMGCGIGGRLSWTDMEVLNDESGKPYVLVNPETYSRLDLHEDIIIHLSLTHGKEYALAQAILEAPSER